MAKAKKESRPLLDAKTEELYAKICNEAGRAGGAKRRVEHIKTALYEAALAMQDKCFEVVDKYVAASKGTGCETILQKLREDIGKIGL